MLLRGPIIDGAVVVVVVIERDHLCHDPDLIGRDHLCPDPDDRRWAV